MSSQTSGVTGGDLRGFVEQEEISNLDFFGKEPMSSEWTDEKHSLYLKSMEASFVHQLYSSMDSSSLHSQRKHHSHVRSSKYTEPYTTGQRIKVGRGEPPPQRSEDSQLLLQKTYVQHYRARGKEYQAIHESALLEGPTMTHDGRIRNMRGLMNMPQHSLAHEEFSDQNFDENDDGGGSSSLRTIKKTKNAEAVAPSKDQVVPLGKSLCMELPEHCSSLNERIQNEWLTNKTSGSH